MSEIDGIFVTSGAAFRSRAATFFPIGTSGSKALGSLRSNLQRSLLASQCGYASIAHKKRITYHESQLNPG
jgi:hypothetical protein